VAVDTSHGVQPYTIEIDEEILVDLRRRLEATRWPDEIEESAGRREQTWRT
jgi:hypothetical protein